MSTVKGKFDTFIDKNLKPDEKDDYTTIFSWLKLAMFGIFKGISMLRNRYKEMREYQKHMTQVYRDTVGPIYQSDIRNKPYANAYQQMDPNAKKQVVKKVTSYAYPDGTPARSKEEYEKSLQQNQRQPQYRQPQYGAPQYQAPQYQQPQYGAPQYQQPRYGQPQYGAPQYQQPQYQAPQYQQSQYGTPQYGQPQFGPQYRQPYDDNLVTAYAQAQMQGAFMGYQQPVYYQQAPRFAGPMPAYVPPGADFAPQDLGAPAPAAEGNLTFGKPENPGFERYTPEGPGSLSGNEYTPGGPEEMVSDHPTTGAVEKGEAHPLGDTRLWSAKSLESFLDHELKLQAPSNGPVQRGEKEYDEFRKSVENLLEATKDENRRGIDPLAKEYCDVYEKSQNYQKAMEGINREDMSYSDQRHMNIARQMTDVLDFNNRIASYKLLEGKDLSNIEQKELNNPEALKEGLERKKDQVLKEMNQSKAPEAGKDNEFSLFNEENKESIKKSLDDDALSQSRSRREQVRERRRTQPSLQSPNMSQGFSMGGF